MLISPHSPILISFWKHKFRVSSCPCICPLLCSSVVWNLCVGFHEACYEYNANSGRITFVLFNSIYTNVVVV
jgi:hypothetical protein